MVVISKKKKIDMNIQQFIDYPWQEDIEIEIVSLMEKSPKLRKSIRKKVFSKGGILARLSDKFIDALENLKL